MNNKLTILIAVVLLNFSCKNKAENSETATAASKNIIHFSDVQFKNLPIEIGALEQKTMDVDIDANGVVDVPPDKVYMISYPINGFISGISHNLLPGRYVKKGEVLATIQSLELLQLQEDYLNETTKNEFLVQEFTRQKNLLNEDATAKRKLQETENNLKINQLKIRAFAEKLKLLGLAAGKLSSGNISANHNIVAQNNGFVKTVNVANGKNFMPSDVLFEIINTDHMHVELKVFGQDANSVKLGQSVEFKGNNGQIIYGKVYLVDKTFDAEKKSLNIHVHIANEAFEQSLRPGQFISAKIKTDNHVVSALKESAVLTTSDGKFVFVIDATNKGKDVKKIEVKTGAFSGGYIEILNPEVLKGQIITKGGNFVDNSATGDE